ncbi:flagellar basal body P-ring formation protein FlgA [Pararobbsia silviterrae]|uniref:Flagellar basal body P-ring formation protein FlgA n=2 Tax=Pararobbsia silviterrae TaxID=1792498 RepID=A0A494X4V4_9BURK|nr:flagellar basal body P-ring formation protein FlgA [Pararobbsia silviterrae]
MPSLETIEPTQSMGTAMSPAARFAAAADLRHDAAQAASGAAGNAAQASNDDAQRAPALQRVHAAAPQVIVESSNGPPIEHSVTISHAELAVAGAVPVGKQDPAVIMKVAEDFLREQAAGLPGRVTITVPPVGPHGLAACDNLQAFMAPGAPVWGRTTVGVRCVGDRPWTLYVLARISVEATYYVAARQIMPGDVIQATDLLPRDGDLAVMPRAIVTDPSQAVGAVAQNRITPGLPVRTDLIRSVNAIQLGQTVKVVAEGNGFSISTDGSALNNAGPGQQVRVKTDNGQTVVGTATGRGVVQIPM